MVRFNGHQINIEPLLAIEEVERGRVNILIENTETTPTDSKLLYNSHCPKLPMGIYMC